MAASFDSIDRELMLKAVRHHTNCPWVLLYIERWLKAPVQLEDGSVVLRTARLLAERRLQVAEHDQHRPN